MATQEEQDIKEIKGDIVSIRRHLDKIKEREDDSIIHRAELNRKLDIVVNSLTDNDFNAKNGYLTRLTNTEKIVLQHDTYFKALFVILIGSGIIGLIFKFLIN